jgi:hypothetical protein
MQTRSALIPIRAADKRKQATAAILKLENSK